MALTPSSIKRSIDSSGDDILTFATGTGSQAQGVALVNDAGAQVGVVANPLAVADAAVLAALGGYATNDLAEAGALTYVGKESPAGEWLVQRIDATSGLEIRYAAVANNPAVLSYAEAWADRAGLTFGTWREI